ncbi:MAG TPA: AraC family transcriptional regulator [Bacteroidales bacterium]|nr:AraC family transcriptional regulator [Bacteroidales bacterium]
MKPFYQKLVTLPDQSVIFFDEEKPHFDVPWHFHPEIEILYVFKSTGTSYIGDSINSFNKGAISIIGENVPHWWKSDKEYFQEKNVNGIKALIIQFKKEIFDTNFINIPEMNSIKELLEKSKRGIQFLGDSRERLGRQMVRIFRCAGIKRITELIILLDMMANTAEFRFHASIGYTKIINTYDFNRFNKVHEYMVNNFTVKIALDDVCDIVNMTPTALCRYFKRHTGKTLFSFLNEIRIGHACKLMIEENTSISDACFRSGFNNLSHFNMQFKKAMHLTPSAYLLFYKHDHLYAAKSIKKSRIPY